MSAAAVEQMSCFAVGFTVSMSQWSQQKTLFNSWQLHSSYFHRHGGEAPSMTAPAAQNVEGRHRNATWNVSLKLQSPRGGGLDMVVIDSFIMKQFSNYMEQMGERNSFFWCVCYEGTFTCQQTQLNVGKKEHAACTPLPFLPQYGEKTLTSFLHVLAEIYGIVHRDLCF